MKLRTALKGATAPIALSVALIANPALAQDEGDETSEEIRAETPGEDEEPVGATGEASTQGAIFVTGSRIRRDEFSSASPITLVDPEIAVRQGLMRADQIELVRTFGMQTQRDVDKFAGLDVGRSPEGCPLLRDVAGWLECRVESRLDAGDRTHFLAEIVGGSPPGHDIEILRMQGLLASASDEMKAELKRQLDHDAGIDRQAISAWRAAHRTG